MEKKQNNRTSASSRRSKGKQRDSLAAQQAQRNRDERLAREQAEREREQRLRARAQQERVPGREARQPAEKPRRAEETPQERPQPKQPRQSRAAQTAKRRKEERQERRQMDGLREKQIRQAKRRTRKRISRTTWRRILVMSGVVLAVILSMVIFFRGQVIIVKGNEYYSQDAIEKASGIAVGDNLLLMSRGEISGNILAELDLVRSVQVTKQLPNTVIITVTEDPVPYAVQDTLGDWYLITADGKAIEKIDEKEARNRLFVENLTINTPSIRKGAKEIVSVAAPKGKEIAAQAQFDALTALLRTLGEKNYSDLNIISVSVPSANKISLLYDKRFTVELGDDTELDYKLAYLKTVLAEQSNHASGTIDLTLSEGKVARVMLDD